MSYCISDIVILRKEQNKTFKHPFFQEVLDGANLLPRQALPFFMPRKEVMIVAEVKMTAKQKRFCDEYLIDLNATQAAIRAGYSEKTAKQIGQENLTKPDLKIHIEKRMAEMESALVADSKEVMKYLTSVLRGKSLSSVLARDDVGADRVIEKPPDEKERLKAAELLGKAHMLFTEKVQQEIDMDLNITVDYGDGDDE